MAREGGSRKKLLGLVVALLVALIVVLVLWQQDEASQDVRLDVDMGDAGALVETGPGLAAVAPWEADPFRSTA